MSAICMRCYLYYCRLIGGFD